MIQAGKRFFELYNAPWLDASIKRGDDIILATKPVDKSKYINLESGETLGNYADELKYLVEKNYKPVNLSDSEWKIIKNWF